MTSVKDMYVDPSNTKDILNDLTECKTIGEVYHLIQQIFPEWVVCFLQDFCPGYPHLTKNWHTICKDLEVTPTQIIIVRDLFTDEEHDLVKHFAECFTKAGFAVRRMGEYIPCTKCEKVAIPTSHSRNIMKKLELPIPENKTLICKKCQ